MDAYRAGIMAIIFIKIIGELINKMQIGEIYFKSELKATKIKISVCYNFNFPQRIHP
jgi:hypothetical protein